MSSQNLHSVDRRANVREEGSGAETRTKGTSANERVIGGGARGRRQKSEV